MSIFVEAAHPRTSTGRFAPVTHGEPDLGLAPDPMRERLTAARDVLEEYADLEILDHSPAWRETVALGELGDPRLALGNCWAATNELIEQVGAAKFDAEWLDEITIRRRRLGGLHVALLAGDADGTYVVDYTARQFHPDLPFPFVASFQDWMATVQKASGTVWELDD